MACYAYSVLTQWFSSVCSGAGSETPLSKESKQVRRPGLRARLLAMSDDARARWYMADYSAFRFRAQVTGYSFRTSSFEGYRCNDNFLSWRYFESAIKGPPSLAEDSVLTPIQVWCILVLFIANSELSTEKVTFFQGIIRICSALLNAIKLYSD